jgi:hypothetical protein
MGLSSLLGTVVESNTVGGSGKDGRVRLGRRPSADRPFANRPRPPRLLLGVLLLVPLELVGDGAGAVRAPSGSRSDVRDDACERACTASTGATAPARGVGGGGVAATGGGATAAWLSVEARVGVSISPGPPARRARRASSTASPVVGTENSRWAGLTINTGGSLRATVTGILRTTRSSPTPSVGRPASANAAAAAAGLGCRVLNTMAPT